MMIVPSMLFDLRSAQTVLLPAAAATAAARAGDAVTGDSRRSVGNSVHPSRAGASSSARGVSDHAIRDQERALDGVGLAGQCLIAFRIRHLSGSPAMTASLLMPPVLDQALA